MVAVSYRSDKRVFIRRRNARVANGNSRGAQTMAVVRYGGFFVGLSMVALRGNREPGSRYLLAIAIRCRILIGLGPICAVSRRVGGYGIAT